MDLLNIYYTEESSVLTEGEMSFTLYANSYKTDTQRRHISELIQCCRAWLLYPVNAYMIHYYS